MSPSTPTSLESRIQELEARLEQALRHFAEYEAELNGQLREADDAERAALFERRAAYEVTLGIEELVEQIECARQALRKQAAPA